MLEPENQFKADDEALLRLQASNPLTSPKLLQKLSQNSDITLRRLVALNPNAPVEILWKLGVEFPQEVLANPLLPLLRFESSAQPDILEGLFNLMNNAQKLTFKKIMVQQTIYYVTQKLPSLEQDEGERGFINLAKDWLENPTEELASRASSAAVFDCVDGGVRYHDYPAFFLAPAEAAGADTGLGAAKCALRVATAIQESVAHQWQIATAWAILYGESLPLLDGNHNIQN